jgi:hypothetical protein
MATMMHLFAGASSTPLKWQDSQQQPPSLPNSGSSSSRRSYNKGSWDQIRDQGLEREQRVGDRQSDLETDWNYNSGSGGHGSERYHNQDERYGSHHGNHGYATVRRLGLLHKLRVHNDTEMIKKFMTNFNLEVLVC